MEEPTKTENFTDLRSDYALSREFLLQVIRHKIKDYCLRDRAIFELSYYSTLSVLELITLNVSDIDVVMRSIRLKRGNETLFIPLSDECCTLLKQLTSSVQQKDSPVFLNNKGERLNLSNLSFITRRFSIEFN